MGQTVSFDYFYGGQSDTFSYYRIPLLRSWVYAFLDYSNRLSQLPPSPTGPGRSAPMEAHKRLRAAQGPASALCGMWKENFAQKGGIISLSV